MKLVINASFGGFSLSEKAVERIAEIQGRPHPDDRADPILVRVVEELGAEANGKFASLKVVEIPDDVQYEIDDYDGFESIHEVHRSWG